MHNIIHPPLHAIAQLDEVEMIHHPQRLDIVSFRKRSVPSAQGITPKGPHKISNQPALPRHAVPCPHRMHAPSPRTHTYSPINLPQDVSRTRIYILHPRQPLADSTNTYLRPSPSAKSRHRIGGAEKEKTLKPHRLPYPYRPSGATTHSSLRCQYKRPEWSTSNHMSE